MSKPIISSPIYNLSTINLLLSSPSPPSLDTYIQLLSAKIHLLSDMPSVAAISAFLAGPSRDKIQLDEVPAEWQELQNTRIEIGRTLLRRKGDATSAEATFSLAQRECKDLLKRLASSTEATKANSRMIKELKSLRIEAMRELVEVELALGKEGRAGIWKRGIEDLQKGEDI